MLLLLGAGAFGQDVRARVQGLVTDSSQAVVAGATVILRNNDTNVTATTKTNEVGQYLFDYVVAGNYSVTIGIARFPAVCSEEHPGAEPR